ncbi:MAG: MFS transporter [Gammaproteobacteria bacterium]|nr:MFS transporter [Gammaproteobacteria bacterium]
MRADVVFPTLAMLAVLTIGSMAQFAVAVVAPEAAPDIGVDATYIGVFTAIVYVFAMLSGATTGAFVGRYGAIRVCQVTMLTAAAAMGALVLATPMAAMVSAVLLGCAYGPFNPASAHVLAGVSTAQWRPLVFSIKQAGVPLGGTLAGLLVPLLAIWFGWEVGLLAVASAALVVMMMLQLLRRSFDADRKPGRLFASLSVLTPLRLVFGDRTLRRFAITGFAYAGCQVSVGAFYVVYLVVALEMPLVKAGLIFAFVQFGAVFGRIFWGVVAERIVSTRTLLVCVGGLSAVCLGITAVLTPAWPLAMVMVLGFVLGASSFGWVGIFLSEIADLAPQGQASEATGGVQFVYFGGVVVVPPCFGAIINLTGSYTIAFLTIAGLATGAAIYLMQPARFVNKAIEN